MVLLTTKGVRVPDMIGLNKWTTFHCLPLFVLTEQILNVDPLQWDAKNYTGDYFQQESKNNNNKKELSAVFFLHFWASASAACDQKKVM